MNVVILYEKFSHIEKIMHLFEANAKKDPTNGFCSCMVQTKNNYYFVSCVGCMHTLNTIYALRKKIEINVLIRIGSCGVINNKIPLESKLLIDSTVNIDAISQRHFPQPKTSSSNKLYNLLERYSNYSTAKAYTIDLIWQSADSSADVVDMETSSLYAYANHLGVEAISISVARDNSTTCISAEKQAEIVMQISKEIIHIIDNFKEEHYE